MTPDNALIDEAAFMAQVHEYADSIDLRPLEADEAKEILLSTFRRIASLEAQLSQAQAVPTEKLHNACTYALEWLNECGGNLAHNVIGVLEQALAASPTPPDRNGLPTWEQLYSAWYAIGADVAGLEWSKFVTKAAEAPAHGIQGEGNE